MRIKYILIFFLLIIFAMPCYATESGWVATASSGDGDYKPEYAIDSNMKTRWSSDFSDNQWWQVDFGKPQKICGATLRWETAFGEKYNAQVCDTGGNWKTVYEVKDGDGNTDIIYFKPVEAVKFRLNCLQRGTGWGFSIWEAHFQNESDAPIITASSSKNGFIPALIMDGDNASSWHSDNADKSQINIKLNKELPLGGIILYWGEDYARAYSVEVSSDKEAWREVFKTENGNGGEGQAYFKAVDAREIRINCTRDSSGKGFALSEIELKSAEEQVTPIKGYQALAKDSPIGYYPMWLRRLQEFWTIVGVLGDDEEGLLSETGSFEPYKGGFSVMPFVVDGKKLYTSQDCRVSQSLLKDFLPLPSVRWEHGDWSIDISAIALDEPGQSYGLLRYRFKNLGKNVFNGKLALAIRPVQINPLWQYGGFSPIKSAECSIMDDAAEIYINKQRRIVSLTKPEKAAALSISGSDVIDFIKEGALPDSQTAQDSEGRVSIGLLYDLNIAPYESEDFFVLFPMHQDMEIPADIIRNPAIFFDKQLDGEGKRWEKLLDRITIDIPEKRLIDVMKSNIAYILINKDGPWIKPGPRNYDHSWLRDGALTSAALLRMGFKDEVREWLDAVSSKAWDNGYVPFIIHNGGNASGFNSNGTGEGNEYDSQGEYVFMLRQYVDYTRDMDYLRGVYPKVVKALEFAGKLRQERMTPNYQSDTKKKPYYGILPQSNSHEGYYPAMHSYWDDFWVLKGLKDGVYLAGLLGKSEDAEWMQKEADDFRKCIYESIKMVIKRDNIDYIPGCVEKGDFDSTSTAIAITACGEVDYMPQPYLKNTFDRYFREFEKRLSAGGEATFTPYEVRSANAFIRMGEGKSGLTMLRYFVKDSVRPFNWNHMAEVVHAKPRTPSYIGDMPHTWVGSGYIDALRTIFVYEHDDRLMLCAGIDTAWLDRGISVKNMPTAYGSIDYTFKKKDGNFEFSVSGNAKPPKGFELILPEELLNCKVTLNGSPKIAKNGRIDFSNLPVSITIVSSPN